MATQKQVLSYTSEVITTTTTNYTVFTCPADKIAKIEFNFANFFAPDGSVLYNNYAQLFIQPSGSNIERDFGYITGGITSNGHGYTMYPNSTEKKLVHQSSTSTNLQMLFQANPGENFATPQTVSNLTLFPTDVYLNSGDAFKIKIGSSQSNNYTFYLNGLILIEDSDA